MEDFFAYLFLYEDVPYFLIVPKLLITQNVSGFV